MYIYICALMILIYTGICDFAVCIHPLLCCCVCVCRYSVDIVFDKQVVNKDSLKDLKGRRRARFEIKKKFEER